MGTVWARRREDLLSDCLVSPDVFLPMVDRLAEFVVPYQLTGCKFSREHPRLSLALVEV